MKRNLLTILAIVIFVTICSSCAQPEQSPTKEEPVTKEQQAVVAPSVEEPVVLSPRKFTRPKEDEVRQALKRVFDKLVEIPREPGHSYLSGDFNGDGSEDIAVVVKPAQGSMDEINSDLANWTTGDPTIPSMIDPNKAVQALPPKPDPIRFVESELLLAVIHGYGPQGWHNQEAMQTYLLRNAAGSHLKTQSVDYAIAAVNNKGRIPRLRGDVIEQKMKGELGFLYWTGANYAWQVEHQKLKP